VNSDTDITLSFEQILSATGRSREWLLEHTDSTAQKKQATKEK